MASVVQEPPASALWIVVPAYNEGQVLGETLAGLHDHLARTIVVDDGSTDDTSAVAGRAGAVVVRHAVNLGQGAALQTGIDFALRRDAAFVCTFDADGQHEPGTIARMLAVLNESDADVVLASRFLGTTIGMTSLRGAMLRVAIWMTNRQTKLNLTDTHNGLRMFRRSAAERVRITQAGMAHGSEILSNIAAASLSVCEVPSTVLYSDYSRKKGQRLTNSFKIAFDLLYAAWSR